jgi:predicted nucleic acid-binding protein
MVRDTPSTAIIDACVLYSAPLRDLIVRLAQASLIQARWTDEIHGEWMRSVLKNNPKLNRERLERTRSLMNEAVRGCLVTGYAALVPALSLPDPDDRHVLAAAIQGEAGVIVTFNLSDFPAEALAPYGVDVRHPDELCSELLDAALDEFCDAARLQRLGLKNPPRSVEEFLATLEAAGLRKTVASLRAFADRL